MTFDRELELLTVQRRTLAIEMAWRSGVRYEAPVKSFRLARSAPAFRRQRVRVTADASGLSIDGKERLARSDIAAASYSAATRTVRFADRGRLRGRLELEVADEDEAKALIGALRVGPNESVASTTRGPARRSGSFERSRGC